MAERTLAQNVAQAIADFKAIKDIVNEATGEGDNIPDGTPTSQYAEKIDDAFLSVYQTGNTDGRNEGYDTGYQEGYEAGIQEGGNNEEIYQEGFEAGIKAEYDRFWNSYQENGNRTNYYSAFGNVGWNDDNINPKYVVKPTDATMLFTNSKYSRDPMSDPMFDFSQCNTFTQWLHNTLITEFGEIDVTNTAVNGARYLFYYAQKLKKIKKITVGVTPANTNYFQNCFTNATALEDITFEGEICYNIDMSTCVKLLKKSIESVVNHLSLTASNKTLSLSKTAVNNAFTTDEWAALIAPKQNWGFSLV